jgi:formylglycine-generating enzyme required for sulfatase activity
MGNDLVVFYTGTIAKMVSACACIAACLLLAGCRSEPQTATLMVITIPEDGCMVMVNGDAYGAAPVTIPNVAVGTTYVVVYKEGFRRKTVAVELLPEEQGEVEVALTPLMGALSVASDPPGAKVVLDGTTFAGVTPLKDYPVTVGDHTYELRLENYDYHQDAVTVETDNHYTRTHPLKAKPARLQIFSRPSGATIFLDDQEQGLSTPTRLNLSPGSYTVGLYEKGYLYNESKITLKPAESTSLEVVLEEGDMPLGMVLIPTGAFDFGVDGNSPDERPKRRIMLDAFYMDKFEVTNIQYKLVFPDHTFNERMANYPVVGVTWKEAAQYAEAVGKRLPTEMEWEKAARGPAGREYPWGTTFDPALANVSGDIPEARLMEVGQFREGVSPYGCMDMAGNAYEWTNDWYNPYPGNTDITIDYGNIYRVLRGGSYSSEPFEARSAKRHFDKLDAARKDYGFRCAMDISRPAPTRP